MSCIIVQPKELNKSVLSVKVQDIPILSSKVAAGFPSPADDHLDNALNLNDLLVKHPAATFLVRATGKSMEGVGIFNNDILIVDRSVNPVHGSVVIAAIDGECLVKTFCQEKKKNWLQSANPNFPLILLEESNSVEIWGVVTGVVRQHGSNGRVCLN
ncbi:LexA family protein [Mucilaginibacter calamicampi]|uniref:LexA family protein n=1 Tax=Mucilaginibacter calamicampi TaxID=1302352 RepID=A0ABW2YVY8_9SPHI